MKLKVFVSYARKDEGLATALVNYFEQREIVCFFDKRDIQVGAKYAEEIIRGIEQCDVVVLILTKLSNISENVRNEIDNACNLKKRIIVFRVDNIALSRGLQFYLSTSQWFDAFLYRGEQYFEQLADLLLGLPISPFSSKIIRQRKILLRFLQLYAIASIAVFCILGIPILEDYSVVNITNSRGIRFVDAIKASGLKDIESKKWKNSYNIAPPQELYVNAKREIFISGVTLGTTLEQHREYLRDALERGVKVRLLMLHPHSADSFVVSSINKRFQSFAISQQNSLAIIKNDTGTFKHRNMEIRFAELLPSLLGVLIDGDIGNSIAPVDNGGIIRVSPYFKSPSHGDWYLQFSRTDNDRDAFSDFASEYRYYWDAAIIYSKVIN